MHQKVDKDLTFRFTYEGQFKIWSWSSFGVKEKNAFIMAVAYKYKILSNYTTYIM